VGEEKWFLKITNQGVDKTYLIQKLQKENVML
jgi:hypothetical protein